MLAATLILRFFKKNISGVGQVMTMIVVFSLVPYDFDMVGLLGPFVQMYFIS